MLRSRALSSLLGPWRARSLLNVLAQTVDQGAQQRLITSYSPRVSSTRFRRLSSVAPGSTTGSYGGHANGGGWSMHPQLFSPFISAMTIYISKVARTRH